MLPKEGMTSGWKKINNLFLEGGRGEGMEGGGGRGGGRWGSEGGGGYRGKISSSMKVKKNNTVEIL